MTDPVAITGVGAVTPLGMGADALYQQACRGVTGVVDGDAACSEFVAADHLSRRELKRNGRFAQLALVAAAEAIGNAGWNDGLPYRAESVQCLIGSGLGGLEWQGSSDVDATALTVPLMMTNSAAASVCMRWGLGGESLGVSGACAAGAQAIGAAVRAIRSGAARAVVAGGAEAPLVARVRASFRQAGALSESGNCRPFDAARDGFVMGEGAGILVLESLADARARGAEILGTVEGYGASSDAYHLTASPPDGGPAARAITAALADAGRGAEEVGYLNAHGTATVLNDAHEVVALRKALGGRLDSIPLSSTKGATGHLFGAGGAVEAILTLLALRSGTAPPTYGLQTPDPELGALCLLRTAGPIAGSQPIGLSSSFGFGGHNAVLALAAGTGG